MESVLVSENSQGFKYCNSLGDFIPLVLIGCEIVIAKLAICTLLANYLHIQSSFTE